MTIYQNNIITTVSFQNKKICIHILILKSLINIEICFNQVSNLKSFSLKQIIIIYLLILDLYQY